MCSIVRVATISMLLLLIVNVGGEIIDLTDALRDSVNDLINESDTINPKINYRLTRICRKIRPSVFNTPILCENLQKIDKNGKCRTIVT